MEAINVRKHFSLTGIKSMLWEIPLQNYQFRGEVSGYNLPRNHRGH